MRLSSGFWLSAALVALACGGDRVFGETAGVEGAACYPNGTCDAGLVCASNVCVDIGGGTGGNGMGGNGSNTGGTGSGGASVGGGSMTAMGGGMSSGGSGGVSPNTGGGSNTGGASDTGGASNTGGASDTGGVSNTGGASDTGGSGNTGGSANSLCYLMPLPDASAGAEVNAPYCLGMAYNDIYRCSYDVNIGVTSCVGEAGGFFVSWEILNGSLVGTAIDGSNNVPFAAIGVVSPELFYISWTDSTSGTCTVTDQIQLCIEAAPVPGGTGAPTPPAPSP